MSSNAAPRLDWEFTGAEGSAVNAGMGFGVTLDPDLVCRSLSVGLVCCLSLRAETFKILFISETSDFSSCVCILETALGLDLDLDNIRASSVKGASGLVPFDLEALWGQGLLQQRLPQQVQLVQR